MSATGFAVRPAGEEDVPALFAIRTGVRENRMDMARLAAAGVTPAAVAALLRGGNAAAWLGERAGSGRAGSACGFSLARAGVGDVFALFVLPGFEGQGLGGLLLHEAERWLALRGIEDAWLLTGGEPGLRAPGFYAARGWRATGRGADGQIRFTKRLRPGRG